MKDLGELLRYLLGIEVVKDGDDTWMLQGYYALDMLAKYGMSVCMLISTPLECEVVST